MILKSHFLNYVFECVTDCSNLNTQLLVLPIYLHFSEVSHELL